MFPWGMREVEVGEEGTLSHTHTQVFPTIKEASLGRRKKMLPFPAAMGALNHEKADTINFAASFSSSSFPIFQPSSLLTQKEFLATATYPATAVDLRSVVLPVIPTTVCPKLINGQSTVHNVVSCIERYVYHVSIG